MFLLGIILNFFAGDDDLTDVVLTKEELAQEMDDVEEARLNPSFIVPSCGGCIGGSDLEYSVFASYVYIAECEKCGSSGMIISLKGLEKMADEINEQYESLKSEMGKKIEEHDGRLD